MWHYFTELLIYIGVAYVAGCILGACWRTLFATDTVSASTAAVAAPMALARDTAPAPPPQPKQVPTPAPAPAPQINRVSEDLPADDLLRIKGIGPKNDRSLRAMGVNRFAQIANWTGSDVSRVERELEFDGRIEREEWIRQAKLLANGQDAEFERLFGGSSTAAPESEGRTYRVQGTSSATPAKSTTKSMDQGDDLLVIRGIGPKNDKALRAIGITRFEQIANWTDADIERVERELEFDGRIAREEWISQARLLADGKNDEYARLYGSETKRSGISSKPKGISGPRGGKADDLQRLSGVGPKYEKVLHSLGFFHFDQIAEWTSEQVDWVDNHLNFNGRIQREEWIRQAKLLADGDEKQFEKEYGTGGLKSAQGAPQSGSRTRKT